MHLKAHNDRAVKPRARMATASKRIKRSDTHPPLNFRGIATLGPTNPEANGVGINKGL